MLLNLHKVSDDIVTVSEKHLKTSSNKFLSHRGHHVPGPIDARAWGKNFCDSYQAFPSARSM